VHSTRQRRNLTAVLGFLQLEPKTPELRLVPWVFHKNGRQMKGLRKVWRKAATAAGLPGLIPHDLRHSCVRNLERAGVPRSTAMALVGHKTQTIYSRYAVTDEAMLREGTAKLATYLEGKVLGKVAVAASGVSS
jgi:integrase